MKRTPEVAIIILNWNSGLHTRDCLASLAQIDYKSYWPLVVDNGSTDDSLQRVREAFPEVPILENGRNLGFTGGNNIGLRWALERGADYMLLLNDDTEVAPDFLRQLVEAAEADPAVGMAGPTIRYFHEPEVIWSAGGEIDCRRGQTRMLGLSERDTGQFGLVPRDVDFVTGCALLARRRVLEEVGLLDDRFFAYYEETEWCVRAAKKGFKIVHVPKAIVWHKIQIEKRDDSPQVVYYMTRNRLLFLRSAGLGWRAWFSTLLGDILRTFLAWSLMPRWKHKRPHRRALLRAVMDASRGRWGFRPVGVEA